MSPAARLPSSAVHDDIAVEHIAIENGRIANLRRVCIRAGRPPLWCGLEDVRTDDVRACLVVDPVCRSTGTVVVLDEEDGLVSARRDPADDGRPPARGIQGA